MERCSINSAQMQTLQHRRRNTHTHAHTHKYTHIHSLSIHLLIRTCILSQTHTYTRTHQPTIYITYTNTHNHQCPHNHTHTGKPYMWRGRQTFTYELVKMRRHCNTLQQTATHCNTLQHTATPCNTPQLWVVMCQIGALQKSCLTWEVAHRPIAHAQTHAHNIESFSTYEWVMFHIWMGHVSHMNESCLTQKWVMQTPVAHAHERVISHIVSHMNGSHNDMPPTHRLFYMWVMFHICMSHVSRLNESCRMHTCICIQACNITRRAQNSWQLSVGIRQVQTRE